MKKYLHFIIALILSISANSYAQQQPNVILIITDQHSGQIMTQKGYPYLETPGIDKIAKQGVTFTRSYCTNPVCTSSRKSFMTGLMPEHAGAVTDKPSIGGLFANAGYNTAYFGKWHVGGTEIDEDEAWHQFQTYSDGHDDTEIKNWTLDYLQQQHDKPFFVVTSFMNPHDCCELARNIAGLDDNYHDGPVPENMDTAYCPPLPFNFAIPPNEPEGVYGRRNQEPGDEYYKAHPTMLWTEVEWRQYMYGYDRLVEKVDKHIEDIVNKLETLSMLENTIIIYTADHGDGHAAHYWNQKKNFYEEAVNIPFIISWKGKTISGKTDTTNVVSNGLDMFPTMLSLAGIEAPATPGLDLGQVILQSDSPVTALERDFVVSEISQKVYTGRTPGMFLGRMLVSKRYKYMLFDKGVNREQLFDIEADPGELSPVTDHPEYAEVLQDCREKLIAWCETYNDPVDPEAIYEEYDKLALLDSLYFNGTPMEGFDPNIHYYETDTIESETYSIYAKPMNSGANIVVNKPVDIFGDSAQQVTRLLVISKDGMRAEEYFIRIKGEKQETGIEASLPEGLKVFPNPANGVVHISSDKDRIRFVEVFNSAGSKLIAKQYNALEVKINLDEVPDGMLILKITEGSGRTSTTQLIRS